MKSNIGIINALVRITCGLTIVAYFTAKLSRKPWCNSYLLMILLGAMKVGEGIVRYCPVTDLFQKGQGMMDRGNTQQNTQSENQSENKPGDNHISQNLPADLVDSIKSVLE